MATRTVGARQELVGDVADQNVRERELLPVLDDRAGLTPDQIAALELVEDAVDVGIGAEREQRVVPEHLPHDRSVQE